MCTFNSNDIAEGTVSLMWHYSVPSTCSVSVSLVQVQCCSSSAETIRTIKDPRHLDFHTAPELWHLWSACPPRLVKSWMRFQKLDLVDATGHFRGRVVGGEVVVGLGVDLAVRLHIGRQLQQLLHPIRGTSPGTPRRSSVA